MAPRIRVNPVVIFNFLDHYVRRNENQVVLHFGLSCSYYYLFEGRQDIGFRLTIHPILTIHIGQCHRSADGEQGT